MGVTALIWACLQSSGPMDLKEKCAVGRFQFPCACCLLDSVRVLAWEVLIWGLNTKTTTGRL